MPGVAFFVYSAQQWIINHGITLAILLVLALLVPRIGRFVKRILTRRLDTIDPGNKSRLALIGAGVYITQLIAYFFLIVATLQQFGFSPTGAAIPATVISAALGLGAQSIIADFLAGFFIISEKQFGVGDWVQFIGPNIDVQGDVMQITMRATTVRTLNGETVIVPNSTARVCVNHSNFWARAVVVISIPLLGSQSIHEAIARSERATRRALASAELHDDVTGDLDVHPAVDIQKPTTVGMPWLVDMRFVVQVNPARQWAVERAIRTAILEEFWQEYGSATTVSGAVREKLESEPAITTRTYSSPPLIDVPVDPDPESAATVATTSKENTPTAPQPAVTRDIARQSSEQSRSDLSVEQPPESEQETDEDEVTGVFREANYSRWWGKMGSLGGRVRPSTTVLFVVLFFLLWAKAWTVEADSNVPGNTSSQQQLAPEQTEQNTEPSAPTTQSTTATDTSTVSSTASEQTETSVPEATSSQQPLSSEPDSPARQDRQEQPSSQTQQQSPQQQGTNSGGGAASTQSPQQEQSLQQDNNTQSDGAAEVDTAGDGTGQ